MGKTTEKAASLTVLLAQLPRGKDKQFIEVRQWKSFTGEHCDLVVEHSHLESEDLRTEVEVVPFFLNTEQVLNFFNGRKGE